MLATTLLAAAGTTPHELTSCRGKEVTAMHVLAIYSINEHLADMMAEAANERRVKEAKAARPKTSRFAFLTSRFAGRGSSVALAGPAKSLAGS
jgi:hypothetical protein